MTHNETGWPDSLWRSTAVAMEDCPTLVEEIDCDVAIVGAGYTGLSCALHLAEAGVDCVVIDQAQPGWGCSGRNGGQVNPMWKAPPEGVRNRYGTAEYEAMIALVSETCDLVFELIQRYDISCDAIQPGHLHTAVGKAQMKHEEEWCRQWRFPEGDVRLLDHDEVMRLTGTNAYDGATLSRRGGSVQPLSYARGLACAAQAAGARIFGNSRALEVITEGGRRKVTTSAGALRCQNVVIGTNGYTGKLWNYLDRTIVPVASLITATAPLPDDIVTSITPDRHAVSEASGVPHYYRIDSNNRMVFGGRGSISGKLGRIDTSGLRRQAIALYPALKNARWHYDWGGYVAMTSDHRPVMLELDNGVYAGLGYNGRGVAMATMMGKQLALKILTGHAPLQVERPRAIPFHALYPVGIISRMIAGKIRDLLTRRL